MQIQISQNIDSTTIYLPTENMDAVVIDGVEVDVKAVVELVIVADVVILVGTIEEKYDESLILNMYNLLHQLCGILYIMGDKMNTHPHM